MCIKVVSGIGALLFLIQQCWVGWSLWPTAQACAVGTAVHAWMFATSRVCESILVLVELTPCFVILRLTVGCTLCAGWGLAKLTFRVLAPPYNLVCESCKMERCVYLPAEQYLIFCLCVMQKVVYQPESPNSLGAYLQNISSSYPYSFKRIT